MGSAVTPGSSDGAAPAEGNAPRDGIHFERLPDEPGQPRGQTLVRLYAGGTSVSHLYIVPLTIRVGLASVRMDGIAGVGTEREHRNKGYSRRVLEATVERMRRGDAALSMLYGIPNFYPKFGYATAGPDHLLYLTYLWRATALPHGWRVRTFEPADLPHVQRLYDLNTRHSVGAAVRGADDPVWEHLTTTREGDGPAGCRVAVDPSGQVRAYAWRATHFWYPRGLERRDADAFVISEVMADGPAAADAILAACRLWARERSEERGDPYKHVLIGQPPEGPVAAAAMLDDSRFVEKRSRSGESMARVLDVARLLRALAPELRERFARSGAAFRGSIRFVTEIGEGTLALADGAPGGEIAMVELPQAALARLALGACDPADQLERLERPPDERLRPVLEALFPLRHQHMHLPDRY